MVLWISGESLLLYAMYIAQGPSLNVVGIMIFQKNWITLQMGGVQPSKLVESNTVSGLSYLEDGQFAKIYKVVIFNVHLSSLYLFLLPLEPHGLHQGASHNQSAQGSWLYKEGEERSQTAYWGGKKVVAHSV